MNTSLLARYVSLFSPLILNSCESTFNFPPPFLSYQVETELKSCPIVDNICIHGDSYHNYIVAIVVPQAVSLAKLAKSLGKDHLTHDQICRDPIVLKEVLRVMSIHCSKARLHKNEIPAKVLLVSDEWSPDTGLVTAAMKIRRKNVAEMYKLYISRLYGAFDGAMST